jgi:hypothetical protein
MSRRPDVLDLLRGVKDMLNALTQSGTPRPADYELRITANVATVIEREMVSGGAHAEATRRRLAALLEMDGSVGELDTELIRRVRAGVLDETDGRLLAHLRSTCVAQLAIDNPRYYSYLREMQRTRIDSAPDGPP